MHDRVSNHAIEQFLRRVFGLPAEEAIRQASDPNNSMTQAIRRLLDACVDLVHVGVTEFPYLPGVSVVLGESGSAVTVYAKQNLHLNELDICAIAVELERKALDAEEDPKPQQKEEEVTKTQRTTTEEVEYIDLSRRLGRRAGETCSLSPMERARLEHLERLVPNAATRDFVLSPAEPAGPRKIRQPPKCTCGVAYLYLDTEVYRALWTRSARDGALFRDYLRILSLFIEAPIQVEVPNARPIPLIEGAHQPTCPCYKSPQNPA